MDPTAFSRAKLPAIRGSSGGAEYAADDRFLGLPEEGHGEGERDEGEHHEEPVSGFAQFGEVGGFAVGEYGQDFVVKIL